MIWTNIENVSETDSHMNLQGIELKRGLTMTEVQLKAFCSTMR